MARITTVKKAQKERTCGNCRATIAKGDPYKWVKTKTQRGGILRVRCAACPTWRPSELTSSQHRATVYAAQEEFDDTLGAMDAPATADDYEAVKEALEDAVHAAAEAAREAVDSLRESAENMESGFGHATYQSDELNERADTLESAVDDCESWDAPEWDRPEEPDEDDKDAVAAWEDEVQDSLASWWEDAVSDAESMVSELDAG